MFPYTHTYIYIYIYIYMWRLFHLITKTSTVLCLKNLTSKKRGGMKALPLSSSQNYCPPILGGLQTQYRVKRSNLRGVWAKLDDKGKKEEGKKSNKQSLFGSVTEALDFSQVRSVEDAQLLEEAREATRSGGRMTREQYGALRRKIGGTYKDFFKSYVDVDGQYVEDGWVDKTCKICKKDTKGEARQVDKLGRYVHVACLEKKTKSGNFFTKLFSI